MEEKNKMTNSSSRKKKLSLATILIYTIFPLAISGQETIPATGGKGSGTGGTVTYTVGQLFYHNHHSETGMVAEGVQQPYEIYIVTAIEEAEGIELFVKVYPNPVESILQLKVETSRFKDLSFQLYNMNGMLIESGAILSELTKINMHSLNPAVYFLKIQDSTQKEYKTFKIIKK